MVQATASRRTERAPCRADSRASSMIRSPGLSSVRLTLTVRMARSTLQRYFVERGRADGSIDPEVTPVWAQQLLWAGLYAAWTYVGVGRTSVYEALNLCVRSLVKAVSGLAGHDERA